MKISYPKYYENFRCIAGLCPDSCCHQWEVQVDKTAATFYHTLPGPLGDKLRSVLRGEDGEAVMVNTADGRCPMWRQDGLCQIQAELGHDALCKTCREFPRLTHDYGTFQEWGLELSCPEAARLILSGEDAQWVSIDQSGTGEAEYEEDIMQILLDTRPGAISILRDPNLSVGEALAVPLLYGYEVQAMLDGAESMAFSAEKALRQARELAREGSFEDLRGFFLELEILTPAWEAQLKEDHPSLPWQEQHRALGCYFIERYWLQAVADYDLVGRVKLSVLSCLLIKMLGGDLRTAQLYSKEIENSIDNVEAILDGAYTSPALADIRLLDLLLK